MELRLVILSVACFASLIPSAVSINLLAAKSAAVHAKTQIAAIGAETLAAKKGAILKAATDIASIAAQAVALKGQVLKAAAGSIAGSMIKGAANIGATIAKAGLNLVAAKFGVKPTLVQEPTLIFEAPVLQETVELEPITWELDEELQLPIALPPISTVSVDYRPPVIDLPPPPQLSGWNTVYEAVPPVEFIVPGAVPCVYEIVETPQIYTGPLIETFQFGK